MKHYTQILILVTVTLLGYSCAYSQETSKTEMEKLRFMIGDWVGTSSAIINDTIAKQGPVFEKIAYKLDERLITIDLTSTTLQLHTVIYYDDKTKKYSYNPYYKSGNGTYSGEYKDGKFIVWFSATKRLIFQLTSDGNFKEYGETLVEGKWHKYFEDILSKSP